MKAEEGIAGCAAARVALGGFISGVSASYTRCCETVTFASPDRGSPKSEIWGLHNVYACAFGRVWGMTRLVAVANHRPQKALARRSRRVEK